MICTLPTCGRSFDGSPRSKFCSRRCISAAFRARNSERTVSDRAKAGPRICARCKDSQPAINFYLCNTRKDGLSPYCKICDATRKKEYMSKNPIPVEVRREYSRRHRERNRERVRAQGREQGIRKKGISLDAYAALFDAQRGCCAICGRTQTVRRLAIDHDHVTGRVRGLLCNTCNSALGKFRDSPSLLKKASEYILEHSCRLIAISGKKGSGKDTSADVLVGEGFERVSFAGPLKAAVRSIFGWSEVHTDGPLKEEVDAEWGLSPREAMQRIGTDLVRGFMQDLWVKALKKKLQTAWREDPTKKFVVTDCRFENEAELIKSLGGQVWRVVRPDLSVVDTHASETGLDAYKDFDEVITNDADVAALHEKVRVVLTRVQEGPK